MKKGPHQTSHAQWTFGLWGEARLICRRWGRAPYMEELSWENDLSSPEKRQGFPFRSNFERAFKIDLEAIYISL